MRCDCCGNDEKHEIMYRTLDTRVYCWYCSKRTALCCYDKPVLPTTWFRIPMGHKEMESLEKRGHTREFEQGCNPLDIKRPRVVKEGTSKDMARPKYQARAALNFHRNRKQKEK